MASGQRLCCLVASPRRDGNSTVMAQAFAEGASPESTETVFIDDFVSGFLRDCRSCRQPDGSCSIDDGYQRLLFDHIMPAGGIVFATPVYWYGVSAQLKCVLDRLVCYTSSAHSRSLDVIESLRGKRYALLLSSEESSFGMTTGIVQQISDFCRYTNGSLVAVLNGAGNRRGEVSHDPSDPLGQARRIGRDFFDLRATDYRIDTPRPGTVWGNGRKQ